MNSEKSKNLWLCFTSSVAVVAVFVGVFFSVSLNRAQRLDTNNREYFIIQAQNACRQSLYRLSDSLDNSEANIDKISVSRDAEVINELLVKTAALADGAVADVTSLSMSAELTTAATKYFNQLSDYCKCVAEDVAAQNGLTETQINSFVDLKNTGKKLNSSLKKACTSEDCFEYKKADDKNYGDVAFYPKEVDKTTFDYKKLVYDGPFSDSVAKKTFDFERISHQKAAEKLEKYFADYDVKDIKFECEVKSDVNTYMYQISLYGMPFCVQTTTDGRVAQLNRAGYEKEKESSAAATKQTQQTCDCTRAAQKAAAALGYDVAPMWTSEPIDGRVYVNMVHEQNGVACYPDMVKMALDSQGKIVGIDAFGYLANHKTRSLPNDAIGVSAAQNAVKKGVSVTKCRLCFIPDGSKERCCYELLANYEGNGFLIYIDAKTGREADILKIKQDKGGYTVM